MAQAGTLPLRNCTKILIVSDTPGFLERNKRLLDRPGVRILTAASARQALKIHYKERVNLIIARLDMPEMGGDTLCSLIRKKDELRHVSFILVCNNKPAQIERASHCGANALFTRPVNPMLLRQTVAKLLSISPRRDYRAVFKACVRGKKDRCFTAISHNISASGLLIESDKQLRENDLIKGMFVVAGSLLMVEECRVVRSVRRQDGKYDYGVRFSKIEPECQREIENYVANGN
jgi:CheY-like chemotaxis protein